MASTGDILTYSVEVEHAPDIEVELTEPGAQIAGLRIVDVGRAPDAKVGGRVRERRWYKLRADLTGSYVLPPVHGSYRSRGAAAGSAGVPIATSEIFIEVQSVLPADGSAHDIRDVKPLHAITYRPRWYPYAAGAAVLLALVGLATWLWRRRRRRVATPPRPPHEVAFDALNELRNSDFSDAQAVRRYYFAISEVIRAYLEARFGLNATDLTREEILARAAGVAELDATQRTTLRAFLTDTDQVKFAGAVPDRAAIAATYERALAFIEATRPHLTVLVEEPTVPGARPPPPPERG